MFFCQLPLKLQVLSPWWVGGCILDPWSLPFTYQTHHSIRSTSHLLFGQVCKVIIRYPLTVLWWRVLWLPFMIVASDEHYWSVVWTLSKNFKSNLLQGYCKEPSILNRGVISGSFTYHTCKNKTNIHCTCLVASFPGLQSQLMWCKAW